MAFDAYSACESREIDRLVIDTAGRLHVKDNLMEELHKLKRVLQNETPIHHIMHGWSSMDLLVVMLSIRLECFIKNSVSLV